MNLILPRNVLLKWWEECAQKSCPLLYEQSPANEAVAPASSCQGHMLCLCSESLFV